MNDEWAFRQAVLNAPAYDLPRLFYADWIEERGEAARAAFIRAQIAIARAAPWSLTAIAARHGLIPAALTEPWLPLLPSLGSTAEWHPSRAYHRGFGWSVRVKQLSSFLEFADDIMRLEPIGELILPAATRDDWEQLAAAPWLRQIQSICFTTGSMLSEPIRALAHSPHTTGLRSIVFEVCTSPGMAAVVESLVQSPLAAQLRELHLFIGLDRDGDILEELARAPNLALEWLTLVNMGLTDMALARLADLPNPAALRTLWIQDQPIRGEAVVRLQDALRKFPLNRLILANVQLTGHDLERLLDAAQACELRMLDLSGNPLRGEGMQALCTPGRFPKLTSLFLDRCNLHDDDLQLLLRSELWPQLVELYLHEHTLSANSVKLLCNAPAAPRLAALAVLIHAIKPEHREELSARYGRVLIMERNHPRLIRPKFDPHSLG